MRHVFMHPTTRHTLALCTMVRPLCWPRPHGQRARERPCWRQLASATRQHFLSTGLRANPCQQTAATSRRLLQPPPPPPSPSFQVSPHFPMQHPLRCNKACSCQNVTISLLLPHSTRGCACSAATMPSTPPSPMTRPQASVSDPARVCRVNLPATPLLILNFFSRIQKCKLKCLGTC